MTYGQPTDNLVNNKIGKYKDRVLKADRTQLILDTLSKLSKDRYNILSRSYAETLSVDVDLHDWVTYEQVLRLFLFRKPEEEFRKHLEVSEGTHTVRYLNIIGVHRHKHYPLTENIALQIQCDLSKEIINGSRARLSSAKIMLELPPYLNTFYLNNNGDKGVGLDFSASIPLSKREDFQDLQHEYRIRRPFEFVPYYVKLKPSEWKDLPRDVEEISHPIFTWFRKTLSGQTTQITRANY